MCCIPRERRGDERRRVYARSQSVRARNKYNFKLTHFAHAEHSHVFVMRVHLKLLTKATRLRLRCTLTHTRTHLRARRSLSQSDEWIAGCKCLVPPKCIKITCARAYCKHFSPDSLAKFCAHSSAEQYCKAANECRDDVKRVIHRCLKFPERRSRNVHESISHRPEDNNRRTVRNSTLLAQRNPIGLSLCSGSGRIYSYAT